jgi:hypothetical protein
MRAPGDVVCRPSQHHHRTHTTSSGAEYSTDVAILVSVVVNDTVGVVTSGGSFAVGTAGVLRVEVCDEVRDLNARAGRESVPIQDT